MCERLTAGNTQPVRAVQAGIRAVLARGGRESSIGEYLATAYLDRGGPPGDGWLQ